nr:KTSC domain-containing protein [Mesorhizobium sp.]
MPSTSVHKTEYDPERKVLSVWLLASGKCYQFEDVPPETFAEFQPPSPRAASSTATSEITSATVWLDPRSTEQHQRTISLLAGMRLIRRGRPASFCEGKVGHRNERRIREFLLLDNRNRRP